MSGASAADIRAQLRQPVIDSDGHTVEFLPALEGYLRAEGVNVERALQRTLPGTFGPVRSWYGKSHEERARWRVARGPWGGGLPSTLDQATAVLPALLYDRLDELGIDFSVIYPSVGLLFPSLDDEQDRRGACRALNTFNSELFAEFSDRMIPVAEIPMHTPEEAIDELEHAVGLGFRVVVMPNFIMRPVRGVAEQDPGIAQWAVWSDTFGMDSEYDYDPVWAKCRELGISPSFHSAAMGWQNRSSISSYVYNHVGMLGESHHSLAKSLIMGGVTRRFPDLNFSFLEGGVAWAASLYTDLIGHWEKRNGKAIEANDPVKRIDQREFGELFAKYGRGWADKVPVLRTIPDEDRAFLDEFEAAKIERAEDFYDLFVPRFFCGCEADDPMMTTAFNAKANPFGARLNAVFGSDVAHWDVPDMSEVLGEAWEMVEHDLISEDDFRDFTFANPVRFFTYTNPTFFKGTRIEGEVDAFLTNG